MSRILIGGTMRLPFTLLIAVAVLLSCSCRPQPVIKIGLVAPFDGRERALGYDAIYAARLAVREINDAGGVDGHKIALVVLDDGGFTEIAENAAASLVIDPEVLVVIGHGLTSTTQAASKVYVTEGLSLVALGSAPFEPHQATTLPHNFLEAYATLTPFDEVAGPFGGPTYDAVYLVYEAMKIANLQGEITRESIAAALNRLEYEGITGVVYQP